MTNNNNEHTGAAVAGNSSFDYIHSYKYENGQVIEPINVLRVDPDNPFPKSQNLNLVQLAELGQVVITLVANITVKLTNLLNVGAVGKTADPQSVDKDELAKVIAQFEHKSKQLQELVSLCHLSSEDMLSSIESEADSIGDKVKERFEDIGEGIGDKVDKLEALGSRFLSKLVDKTAAGNKTDEKPSTVSSKAKNLGFDPRGELLKNLIEDLIKFIFGNAVKNILRAAGLFGEATSMAQYADQFQTLVVPNVMSTALDDDAFAAMQVSGPNPLVIERVSGALPDKFPVDESAYQKVMGEGDTLEMAIEQKRLYLVDYEVLSVMVPGTEPQQKYVSPAIGLFAVAQGDQQGRLKSVAIQLRQEPSSSNPVFYPFDGESWDLAKVHFQVANGNYHELISHLGLTHLLIEPFAVSTHRMLSTEHPIFKLLLPHLQGTLFINNAAITGLVKPGGVVDTILAGTIESDWQVTINALKTVNFEQRMLPNQLAGRGVEDKDLPLSYPYRDDAMDVWQAIDQWTKAYVNIFYVDDDAVSSDTQLQGWIENLTEAKGGNIQGLGQEKDGKLGVHSKAYLSDILTMVIFTSSAQHAAVNFPQRTVMSYSPVMPLAAYQSPPVSAQTSSSQNLLGTLPPLEQSLIQLLVGQGLGGVYFTRLGDYNRHQRDSYFTNPQVQSALALFRDALAEVERTIGKRNQSRPLYEPLLPSRIPQSINI